MRREKKRSGFKWAFVAMSVLVAGGLAWHARSDQPATQGPVLAGLTAVVYKSPTCGCCSAHAEFLEEHGMAVASVDVSDVELARIRQENGVPETARSCHTTLVDGYAVEGHVPLEALERLFTERPEIDGIALPGMFTGTPGMPGEKKGPIEVLKLDGGLVHPFMSL